MTIQAIETHYKGYRFRSRLEARWAVFFDALGIKWEYEKEGYKFDDGAMYLPDFWIPEWDLFVEVKGPKPSDEDCHKIYQLCRHTHKQVVLVNGAITNPEIKTAFFSLKFWLFAYVDTTDFMGVRNFNDTFFSVCPRCKKPILVRMDLFDPDPVQYTECQCEGGFYYEKEDNQLWFFMPEVARAIKKAKSARFEFGEAG